MILLLHCDRLAPLVGSHETHIVVLFLGIGEGPARDVLLVRLYYACHSEDILIELCANPEFSVWFWRLEFPRLKILILIKFFLNTC